jgi:hypothetical protein
MARKKYRPTIVGKRLLGRNIVPRLLGRDFPEEISSHDRWGEISRKKYRPTIVGERFPGRNLIPRQLPARPEGKFFRYLIRTLIRI